MRNRDVFLTAPQYVHFIKDAQTIWNDKYQHRFTLDFSWGDTRLVYDADNNAVVPLDITYPYEGYGCFAGKVNIVFDSAGNALTCGFLPNQLSKSQNDNLHILTVLLFQDILPCTAFLIVEELAQIFFFENP